MPPPAKSTYEIVRDTRTNVTICYTANLSYNQGIWRMSDTLMTTLPMFILQLTLMMILSRFLHLGGSRLRLSLFVSEMLAGIIMGPSVLGEKNLFMGGLFPFRGNRVLETIANLGIVYYMFLVGLEMDATPILSSSGKAITLAMAGAAMPAATGALLYHTLFRNTNRSGVFFWMISLAVTSFPDVTRDLASRKVLQTELGKTALSTAVINDLLSWLLLVVAIAFVSEDQHYAAVISTMGFVVFCVLVVRPAIVWLLKQNAKQREEYTDYHMCFVLTGVAVCGFITELCGAHSIVGAFVFGLVIPKGELVNTLRSRLEDYVAFTLLPLFYLISGFRFSIKHLFDEDNDVSPVLIFMVVFVASSIKVISTFAVALMFKTSVKDSLALGLFLNTKGILGLIVINTGRNTGALDNQTYTIMAITVLIMTAMPVPATYFLRASKRSGSLYLRRTIQATKAWGGEFLVVACIHSTRNVNPLINLLQSVEATKESPIWVYALHLIELTGRASAMIIMHNSKKSKSPGSSGPGYHPGQSKADSDLIISALERFELGCDDAYVNPLSVVSPYGTMHDDICRLTEEKFGAMILVPFHKLPTADGGLKEENANVRDVNLNLLKIAPCSVGILVDRGLSMLNRDDSSNGVIPSVAMFYLSGPDDREALTFAWKMCGNPEVQLSVIRFIAGKEAIESTNNLPPGDDEDGILSVTEKEVQKQLDDEYVTEFRYKTVDEDNIQYSERMVNCGDDTIAVIKDVCNNFNLFVIGKGTIAASALTSGLAQWSVTPELGYVGDAVVQSDFATDVSVLVVQQYNPDRVGSGGGSKKDDDKGFDTSILDDS